MSTHSRACFGHCLSPPPCYIVSMTASDLARALLVSTAGPCFHQCRLRVHLLMPQPMTPPVPEPHPRARQTHAHTAALATPRIRAESVSWTFAWLGVTLVDIAQPSYHFLGRFCAPCCVMRAGTETASHKCSLRYTRSKRVSGGAIAERLSRCARTS